MSLSSAGSLYSLCIPDGEMAVHPLISLKVDPFIICGLFKTSFPTLYFFLKQTPGFWESRKCHLPPIAFMTRTIRLDQSTLEISLVLWHHMPMAYKYIPSYSILCCRDRQDPVIQNWESQRRKKMTNIKKITVQIQVSLLFRGRSASLHVSCCSASGVKLLQAVFTQVYVIRRL